MSSFWKKAFVFIVFLFLSSLSAKPSFAAACPVSDGGVGDGDSTVDGTITINADTTWSADGTNLGVFDCSGLTIYVTNNAILTLDAYDSGDTVYTNDYIVDITVDNVTIDAGSYISANGQGYGLSRGPGYNSAYRTASYGGYGGYTGVTTNGPYIYGSVQEPSDLGSSGQETIGGGAIKLTISGTLNINGSITANGVGKYGNDSEAGSGGSIWIDTNILDGTGSITATGGFAHGYGADAGSGGRVAVYYTTDNSSMISSIGGASPLITANGGFMNIPDVYASAGTVYLEHKGVDTTHQGTLFVDNAGDFPSYYYAGLTEDAYVFSNIILTRNGKVEILGSSSSLTVADSSTITGDSTAPELKVSGDFAYTGATELTVDGYILGINGTYSPTTSNDLNIGSTSTGGMKLYAEAPDATGGSFTFNNITVGKYGTLYLDSYDDGDTDYTEDYGVILNANNITVNSDGVNIGKISADGLGYGVNRGPGYNSNLRTASYGGYGGYDYMYNNGPYIYGDVYEPNDLGSGGQEQPGGGAIKLVVSGTLTVDGIISSNGNGQSGNDSETGSGGSVWIDTNILDGTGSITATGGFAHGYGADAGSGGRVAVYYTTDNSSMISSIGGASPLITANGGFMTIPDVNASPGTVYLEHKGVDTTHQGTLFVDNIGNYPSRYYAGLPEGSYIFDQMIFTRNGELEVLGSASSLTVNSGTSISGDDSGQLITQGDFIFSGNTTISGVTVNPLGDFTFDSYNLTLGTNSILNLYAWTQKREDDLISPINEYNFGNLTLNAGSTLVLNSYDNGDADYTNDYGVLINASSVQVDATALISANGTGYGAGVGTGVGTGDAGGTYAGYGAINCSGVTGTKYGSELEPTDLGSGGAGTGGAGGGAFRINTTGAMTVNGTISANGADTGADSSGAGSGGSVYLYIAGDWAGNGLISADGGNGSGTCRSGGGGGRVAVYYGTDSYTGITQSLLGSGGTGAEGGSVYTSATNSNPDAVSSLSPSNLTDGSYTSDNTPTFQFSLSDSDGDQVKFQIQIDDSSDFSSPLVDYTSVLADQGVRTFTVGQAVGSGTYTAGNEAQTLSDATYYWQVKSIDANGAESSYVQANNGSIAFGIDTVNPTDPGTPSTTTPTNDTTPTWTWTASSDDGSGLHSTPYTVEWCSNSSFIGCDSNIDSSSSNTYTHTSSLSDGTWYFRVKARDVVSNESNYSELGSVVVDITGPTQAGNPSTTTPTTDTTPTWTWTASSDDGVPVGEYYVQWCDSYVFYSACDANVDTTNTNSYTHTTPLSDNKYYFRVWSFDSFSNQSDYSGSGIVIVDNTPPSTPGTPNTTTPTNDTTPTWTWTASSDGSSGSGLTNPAYTVEWCDNDSFTDCGSNTDTTNINSYTNTTLADGTWYFRVKATDVLGNVSSYSDLGSVQIDTGIPDAPGTPTTSTPTSDTTPTWTWVASYDAGDGGNVSSYTVEWCSNDSFTDCGSNTDSVSTNSYTHSTELSDGVWYFRVKAADSLGNQSVYSSTGTVLIDTIAPSVPNTPTASNPTNDSTPRWDWTGGADTGSGLGTPAYATQWCDNTTFTSCESNTGTSTVRDFTIPTVLADGTWYFRVKSIDAVGNESSYSDYGTTVIDTQIPDQPGLPSTDTPTTDTTPTWTWTASTAEDVVSYRVEWCTQEDFSGCSVYSDVATTSFTHSNALASDTWYFRVRSKDSAGSYSTYSPVGSVIISSDPPSSPGTPTTSSAATTNTTPTWTWTAPEDVGIGLDPTNPYQVQWCSNSSFSDCGANIANASSTTYTHSISLTDGTWYFRVRALDTLSQVSDYSSSGSVIIDTTAPDAPSIQSPSDKQYINTTRPTFYWISDYVAGVTEYSLGIDNGDSGDFTILDISSYSGSTVNTDTHFISYQNFGDGTAENDSVSLYTKSSDQWSSDANNGLLKQGQRTWTITAYDQVGNSTATSKTVYVDLSSPSMDSLTVAGQNASGTVTTDSRNPNFSGVITDMLTGDHVSRYVASGPDTFGITIKKQQWWGEEAIATVSLDFDTIYWSDTGTAITDNTQNRANKKASFSYNLPNSLSNGTYSITFNATDIAGNTNSRSMTLIVVDSTSDDGGDDTTDPTPTPSPTPAVSPSPSPVIFASPSPTPTLEASPSPSPSAEDDDLISPLPTGSPEPEPSGFDWFPIETDIDPVTPIVSVVKDTVGSVGTVIKDTGKKVLAAVAEPIASSPLVQNIQMTLDLWFDREPTQIYDLHIVEVGDDYAVVSWKTNHFATSKVSYGPDRDYGQTVASSRKTKDHVLIMSDLDSGATYYYEVMSYGRNYAYDAWHEFDTSNTGVKISDLVLEKYDQDSQTLFQRVIEVFFSLFLLLVVIILTLIKEIHKQMDKSDVFKKGWKSRWYKMLRAISRKNYLYPMLFTSIIVTIFYPTVANIMISLSYIFVFSKNMIIRKHH